MRGLRITLPYHRGMRMALMCIALFFLRADGAFGVPAEVQISGFTVSERGKEGYWRIQAAEATYSEEMVAVLIDVHARLLDGDREKVSIIGNRGRYLSDKSLLILEGDVEIQTCTGYRFTAPRMEWNSRESTIKSQGGVKLTGSWFMVLGRKLNYSITSSVAVITGDVRTRWTIGAAGL